MFLTTAIGTFAPQAMALTSNRSGRRRARVLYRLMLAAGQSDAEMAELLLNTGADLMHQDWQGKTALGLALASRVPACVELLRVHAKMREKKADELA